MSAPVVRVTYHHENDAWWADSPDLPGFSAAASSLHELRQQAHGGVMFALEVQEVELLEAHEQGGTVVDSRIEGFSSVLWAAGSLGRLLPRALDDKLGNVAAQSVVSQVKPTSGVRTWQALGA